MINLPWNYKNIPNTDEGKTFIKVLRQSLKDTPIGVKVRCRGPRFGRRYDTNMKHATHFTVYLTEKPKFRYVKVMKPTWERVPTKWATSTT